MDKVTEFIGHYDPKLVAVAGVIVGWVDIFFGGAVIG